LLPSADGRGYRVAVAEGSQAETLLNRGLDPSDPLVGIVQAKDDALLRYDVDLNPRYEASRHDLQRTLQSLASELVLPLRYKEQMRGLVSLGRKKSGKLFTPEDLDLLRTLANQSAIALENTKLFQEHLEKGRMEEELKIAHDIQVSMLPERAPALEGFTVAARSISAREVGGDFYDFIELGGDGAADRLGIVVGDVSGKGVSGALLMAASRSTYRVVAESYPSVADVMTIANKRLSRDMQRGKFVALLYAVVDPRQRSLTLSNAGQTQPILCRSGDSKPSYVDSEGERFPLGIVGDCRYEETQLALGRGDVVVFYTDGVLY